MSPSTPSNGASPPTPAQIGWPVGPNQAIVQQWIDRLQVAVGAVQQLERRMAVLDDRMAQLEKELGVRKP